MKNIYLLLLIVVLSPFAAYATHVMGSEIHYRSVGNGKYEIMVKVYRDCNGVPMSQSNIIARCSATTLTLSSPTKLSIRDVTGISLGCAIQSRCAGSSYPYGIEEHIWLDTLDISTYSCCEWTLSWEQCCRNSNITTGQANENFFVSAQLNKCVGANSSPTFGSLPIRLLCYNKNVTYNLGIQDTIDQGDSFSFALVEPLVSQNQSASYTGQFSAEKPLRFLGFPNTNLTYPAGFHLNALNGDLTFRPTVMNEIAVIVIEVSEWRKNGNQVWTLIGKTRRDMQVIVVNCGATSAPPVLAPPYAYEICAGDSLNIPLYTSDSDSADSTSLSLLNNPLAGTVFVHNNGAAKNASGGLHLRTDASMISGQPYYFTVMVKDNGCPLSSEVTRTISVFIRDPAQPAAFYAGPDRSMGTEDTITLHGVDSFNIGQQAYWKSLGDGYFIDSLARDARYNLGFNDKQNCEIRIVRFPLTPSTCGSMDPDTMTIYHWLGDLEIRIDSNSLLSDSVLIEGISYQDSFSYQWWTTSGDGIFIDSTSRNTAYKFGAQDSLNCGAWIYFNSSAPIACAETKDSVWLWLINLDTLAITYSVNILAPDTIFLTLNGASAGTVNWTSTGTGTWQVDSVNHTAMYFPSQADITAGIVVIGASQTVFCGQNMDSDSVVINLSMTALPMPIGITLKLYPNPTDGKLHLEAEEFDRIAGAKVFDVHGKEIPLKAVMEAGSFTWDVSALSRGMYMLVVTDQQGIKIPLRFIVR